MSDQKHIYGLIGYPLGHSFSQKFFTQKFKDLNLESHFYQNFELKDISALPNLVKDNPNLKGFNVTVPHKVSVLQYLDQITDEAKTIGAVNTVVIKRKADKIELIGHNTDIYGFEKSIKPFLKFTHQKALVLGTGGAAKAVVYVLKKLGVDVISVSRKTGNPSICTYQQLNNLLIKSNLLIVNATPVGMHPNENEAPEIAYEFLTDEHLLIDLIYNPTETLFLKNGKEKGTMVLNGLSMLHLQAEKAWEIWKGSN